MVNLDNTSYTPNPQFLFLYHWLPTTLFPVLTLVSRLNSPYLDIVRFTAEQKKNKAESPASLKTDKLKKNKKERKKEEKTTYTH